MGFFGSVLDSAIDAASLMIQNPRQTAIDGYKAYQELRSHDIFGIFNHAGLELDHFGGATIGHALEVHKKTMAVEWERKNRFYIEILDLNPVDTALLKLPPFIRNKAIAGADGIKSTLGSLLGGVANKIIGEVNTFTGGITQSLISQAMGNVTGAAKFNLYATDVSYTPITYTGEPVQIGSAVIDNLQSTEYVEISVTCRDDKTGTIKRWVDSKASQTAHIDGTFGLPADYVVNIRIIHGFIDEDIADDRGFEHSYLCRVSGLDLNKSRNDNGLNELQIKFTQVDTTRAVL